jgi:hypothetical protein
VVISEINRNEVLRMKDIPINLPYSLRKIFKFKISIIIPGENRIRAELRKITKNNFVGIFLISNSISRNFSILIWFLHFQNEFDFMYLVIVKPATNAPAAVVRVLPYFMFAIHSHVQ